MISVEQHLDRVLAAVGPAAPRRTPLAGAHGCVLAEDVRAVVPVPPFDNSAMDGFAVRAADVRAATTGTPVRLAVVADLPAGSGERPEVRPGTAVRIMTGAPVPPGADAVVPVEDTDVPPGPHPLPATVEVRRAVPPGTHVRRAGDDVARGAVVLRAGTPLRARDLSTAASAGHGELLVHPPVRVGVLSTGSELVAPGTPLAHGQIPDSNAVLVAGMVHESGGVPVLLGSVDDDPDALRGLLAARLGEVDAVVTTGGVSAGAYDVVKEVLAPLGDVAFDKVAMQPGKPQGFGTLRDGGRPVPLFALPGNPVSVFVSFQVFVHPALTRMRALVAGGARPTVAAVAAQGWRCPAGRRQYIPVVVETSDAPDGSSGTVRVRPAAAGGSGSHLVASLALADALAVVGDDVEEVHEGDAVRVMMVP
ncbi:gephyrin-like molybdotransferase Glp [Georgenia muralis]|uniref:Molybdopterin molybdenumtransferase n=1 Tax=Georgenia muralis TaxID=154117 RepID=A0A3N4Z3G8_9MICO|nr:gephyrin-like molybdotransferase Glp [Georgenia muralis]RPF27097.1 molybdopterin molybdochelatase [Georgenia muralis]